MPTLLTLLVDPPMPPGALSAPERYPPLVSVDVKPTLTGRHWSFAFADGTAIITDDPEYAQMLSMELFPAGPSSNSR